MKLLFNEYNCSDKHFHDKYDKNIENLSQFCDFFCLQLALIELKVANKIEVLEIFLVF
jgi:hypothetical protein